ncbi:hypothetical protein GGR51DRAFT_543484 [Nemania sp. FL0031]|nr:hypothetical protein GGR51DRAFT_543484 [Nemania sp. FL0031]
MVDIKPTGSVSGTTSSMQICGVPGARIARNTRTRIRYAHFRCLLFFVIISPCPPLRFLPHFYPEQQAETGPSYPSKPTSQPADSWSLVLFDTTDSILMNRRSHKKSRLGCRECKSRHIKCDEKRPACAHCVITHRECHYVSRSATASPGSTVPESDISSPSGTHGSDEAHSPGFATIPRIDPVSSRCHPTTAASPHDNGWELPTMSSSPVGTPVNMNHMEFLLHYRFSVAVPELDSEFDSIATTYMNKLALEFPWLLHVMLAISARHLAVLRPDNSRIYLSEAFQLQNQAIKIFNSEQMSIDEKNCSSALLFSSILGRHMLVDTLAGLDSDGSVLLDDYCRYVQVHSGLRAIVSNSWQLLSESAIWPFLVFAGIQRPRKGIGSELEDLRRWVRESQGLDEESLEACLEAVEMLQVGLDEVSAAGTCSRRHQMAFIWSICNKARFNDLVKQRCPQALVVLAHYTALLYHAKNVWQIGDAGYRFLHTICSVLGPSYENQLWWVRNLVFGSADRTKE